MKRGDFIPSILFILLSFFVCQQSLGLGVGTFSQPGPGFLPFSAGIVIGVLTLVLLIQSIISKTVRSEVDKNGSMGSKGKTFLICLSLFLYTISVNIFGFLLSTFAFVLFFLYIVEYKKIWRLLIIAGLITFGNHLVFVKWLGVSLPKGFLSW